MGSPLPSFTPPRRSSRLLKLHPDLPLRLLNPGAGDFEIILINFNADEAVAHGDRCNAGTAGAEVRIENQGAGRQFEMLYAPAHQGDGFHGGVRPVCMRNAYIAFDSDVVHQQPFPKKSEDVSRTAQIAPGKFSINKMIFRADAD